MFEALVRASPCWLAVAALAACHVSEEQADTSPSTSNPTDLDHRPTADGSAEPAQPPPSGAGDNPPATELPLAKGVYAQVESAAAAPQCPPPLATIATFDGTGFGSRNSTNCRFEPVARTGSTWTGNQTCTDPYSNTRQSEPWQITIKGPGHYTVDTAGRSMTYKLCPGEDLEDWLG